MYSDAVKCFTENVQRYQTAKGDPAGYNLNVGLRALTQTVESDIHDLQSRLHRIEQLLHNLSR